MQNKRNQYKDVIKYLIKCYICNEEKYVFINCKCEECYKDDKNHQNITGIYTIKNKINNKLYIGQSKNINSRWRDHFSTLNSNIGRNRHLQNAWNKYGGENFVFEILEICLDEELDIKEVAWIDKYNSMNSKYGYNKSSGGNAKKKVSEETKRKILESRGDKYKGNNHPLYGIPRSDETKKKLKEANIGKKLSEETKQKMSEKALKGESHPWYGKCNYELILKLAEKNRGVPLSEERKRKISNANKGKKQKPLTEEQKRKMVENRTYTYGENHAMSKLTNDIVEELKIFLLDNNGDIDLASKTFNISKQTVSEIRRIKSWINIRPDLNEKLILFVKSKSHNFSQNDIEKIREMYHKDKINMKKISKIYECDDETIRRIIKKIGKYKEV